MCVQIALCYDKEKNCYFLHKLWGSGAKGFEKMYLKSLHDLCVTVTADCVDKWAKLQ